MLMAHASTDGLRVAAWASPPLVIPLAPQLRSFFAVAEDAVWCFLIYFINCLLTTPPPPAPPCQVSLFYIFKLQAAPCQPPPLTLVIPLALQLCSVIAVAEEE